MKIGEGAGGGGFHVFCQESTEYLCGGARVSEHCYCYRFHAYAIPRNVKIAIDRSRGWVVNHGQSVQ